MGCEFSLTSATPRNRVGTITETMPKQAGERATLLLLGTGNSGKSTIMKQMKILHKNGFTNTERRHYIALVVGNLSQSMYAIIELIQTNSSFVYQNENTEELTHSFVSMINKLFRGNFELNIDIIPLIRRMLQDSAVIDCFESNRSRIINADAVDYFFKQIDRICLPGFLPNDDDILHTRLPTSGVHEITFNYNSKYLTMVDVGGQRFERSKWLHCFEDATSMIYCASLVEYSNVLEEDHTTSAMQESLKVFAQVINNVWFANKSLLLFLNKIDLFESAVKRCPVDRFFEAYTANPKSPKDALVYIKQLYLACNLNPNRTIFTHVTCATDTNNIKATFQVATRAILEMNLDVFGIL
eukprot:gene5994-6690_t